MTNKQVALILAVVLRYFTNIVDKKAVFTWADELLEWLEK